MKPTIRILGFIIILITCSTINAYSQQDKFVPEYSTIMPSDIGISLLKQCSRSAPNKVDICFDLTTNDLWKLENNFKKVLKIKAADCCLLGGVIKDLKNYAFQYTGLIIKNKKYIYINAFKLYTPEDLTTIYKNWKTSPIIVCDGGESYWGVLYDLETGQFTQLSMNGVS